MFESAEVGSTIDKEEYDRIVPQLRVDLINAQYDLQHADFPVIVLIDGDDRPGCAEIVDLMNEWMDPRWMVTHSFGRPTEEERQRPRYWRYWRGLPPAGRIGIFFAAFRRFFNSFLDRCIQNLTIKAPSSARSPSNW